MPHQVSGGAETARPDEPLFGSSGLKKWLPFINTYRTLCLMPPSAVTRVFDEVGAFFAAA